VGKSRLVTTAIEGLSAVYYLAEERDERLQHQSLVREIERLVAGFARVESTKGSGMKLCYQNIM